MSHDPKAAGLGIHWQLFGSNGQEKADYSRGVLVRFTQRDQEINRHVKTIANPRMINFMSNAHFANYFEGCYAVNENDEIVNGPFDEHLKAEKIVVNHYHCKSLEEYRKKRGRGIADRNSDSGYSDEQFYGHDRNEEFDDGILKYREARAKVFQLPDKSHADERLFAALATNLSPTLLPNTPQDFYAGKMETFLTCRAVSSYLKTKILDKAPATFFEEASLKAIIKTLASGASLADIRLLLSELPNILTLPYPVVEELRGVCLQIIPKVADVMHFNNMWRDYVELDYLQRLLQTWK